MSDASISQLTWIRVCVGRQLFNRFLSRGLIIHKMFQNWTLSVLTKEFSKESEGHGVPLI